MSSVESEHLAGAAAFLRDALAAERCASLRLGMVLGSGLKDFAQQLAGSVEIPFADVPHWNAPKVEGHGAALVVGEAAGLPVACLTGRVHLYEGWSPHQAVRPVRTLRQHGVPDFLLSNAAGGIGAALAVGALMVLTDHLNLTGASPLVGPHEPALGPRFVDQSRVWDLGLRELLLGCDPDLRQGVYAGLLGPSYETPAEVDMLRTLGASAVGMSTVHEAMALGSMGARVCGLSLISNLAAGSSTVSLDHDEVIETGRQTSARLTGLLLAFCRKLAG